MTAHLPAKQESAELQAVDLIRLPALVVRGGELAARRFVEFFTATIRNRSTRAAYARSVAAFQTGAKRVPSTISEASSP